jgi:four helix bundle protein
LGFSIYAAHSICVNTRYALRGERDLYHIEAQLYRIGEAYISSLRKQTYRQKGGKSVVQNKNQLREESIDFAIAVSDACDEIHGCSVYVNQLLRCSSSVGANIHEARYAQSRADFISKLEISLKESSETDYWLELLYRKKKLSQE